MIKLTRNNINNLLFFKLKILRQNEAQSKNNNAPTYYIDTDEKKE